jgi:hypothetical protein
MLMLWRRSNDIVRYCAGAASEKSQVQKDAKRFNTATNTTQVSKAMRYSQYVRAKIV